MSDAAERLIRSRAEMLDGTAARRRAKGGRRRRLRRDGLRLQRSRCAGRHIREPSVQMHNRGNGKGGGIAAVGLTPEDFGVSQAVLDSHYLLQIALLDPAARAEVEQRFVEPVFDVALSAAVPTRRRLPRHPGLEVKPPDVQRYLVRVKPAALEAFAAKNGLIDLPARDVEDEFVYRNTFGAERRVLRSLGEKQAFVLSHGRNLMVLKIVGYAEQNVEYYRLEDMQRPRLDRPPALPDQGPRLAPGRGAPVRRAERGAGPQRRLRELPLGHGVPRCSATCGRSS